MGSLPSNRVRFLTFVGDVDNFLFASEVTGDDGALRQLIQGSLNVHQVRCLVVLDLPTLRGVLDRGLEDLDVTGREPGRRPLDDLLREISDHDLLSRKAVAYLHTIRTVRNAAEYSPGNEDFHEGDVELVALMVQEVLREGRRRRYW